jgi:hypothetical protein
MMKAVRRLLLVLIAFAVAGGTTTQLAQSAQYAAAMTMVGTPCDMMMPAAGTDHSKPMTPCKGMTPDCIKLMGCITDVALPAPFMSHAFTVRFAAVDYWPALLELAELVSTPEPLPPRTI